MRPPGASIFNAGNQTAPTATDRPVVFDTEACATCWDVGNFASLIAQPTHITITESGQYRIAGQVLVEANATGLRWLRVRVNGTSDRATVKLPSVSGDTTDMRIETDQFLEAGDYVELVFRHTAGVPLLLLSAGDYSPKLTVTRMAN